MLMLSVRYDLILKNYMIMARGSQPGLTYSLLIRCLENEASSFAALRAPPACYPMDHVTLSPRLNA